MFGVSVIAVGCGGSNPTPTATAPSVSICTVPQASNYGSPSPCVFPPPILPANITVPAGAAFSSPDCDARRVLAAELGLTLVSNCHFTGTLQNAGSGCATNVHGTTTIVEDGAAASWIIAEPLVRPNEILTYTGGPVTLPTTQYHYQTQALWDNARCQ
jgi:hypothetical protein